MREQVTSITKEMDESIQNIYPWAVQTFKKLHQQPEIGLEEHQTSRFVREELSKIPGIDILPPLAGVPTAVIAQIEPEKIEKTILLRCQLDALGFRQQSFLDFSSKNGLHHACGHDGHISALLSAAKLIAENRANLKKKVVFCFQPGEEGKYGAQKLLEELPSLMEAVNQCFALHFHNAINPGEVKLEPGPVTALSNRFTIQIAGKSAHCLAPQAGIDANFIGCSLVSQLYSLTGITVPPMEGCSLVIVKVEGGSGIAMVSSCFKIEGSLRTFSIESYERMKERITKLSESFCSSFGAEAKVVFNKSKSIIYQCAIALSSMMSERSLNSKKKLLRKSQ